MRDNVNVAYFLIPKYSVAYLYDDFTFRQGLEKMRYHGYSAIPVITRGGQYVGTVSEGDFLWRIVTERRDTPASFSMKEAEQLKIGDILQSNAYPPVHITITMDELLQTATQHNFIPVIDDLDNFIGIVTRKDILQYFSGQREMFSIPPGKLG